MSITSPGPRRLLMLATVVAALAAVGLAGWLSAIDRTLTGARPIGAPAATVEAAPATDATAPDEGMPAAPAEAAPPPPVVADDPPSGIIELELAFRAATARAILAGWSAAELGLARKALRIDTWFILAYWATLTGLCLLTLPHLRRGLGRAGTLIAWLPTVAALADLLENALLRRVLDAEGQIGGGTVALAGAAATLKFLLIALTVIPLLVIGSIASRRLFRKTILKDAAAETVVTLDEVIRQETAYVSSRRQALREERRRERPDAEADEPPPVDTGRPIGLAFSGGGIRSATVNLGVLQSLWRRGILPDVDYLSTVSGGGYIGSALSSLLSINLARPEAMPTGDPEQFHFGVAPDDPPRFRTEGPTFPFAPDRQPGAADGFNGRLQLEHLRSHGDFLVRHQGLADRDVLRAIGSVLGGLFYHLVLFATVLVGVAAVYLLGVDVLAGAIDGSSFGGYVTSLADPPGSSRVHPLLAAAGAGVAVTVVSLPFIRWLMWSLPDHWFTRKGSKLADEREYRALWAIFFITLLTAVLVTVHFVGRYGSKPCFLTLPLGVYLGGWAVLLLLHAVVAISPIFGRNSRSTVAGWKGIFSELVVVSVVVLPLPWVIDGLAGRPELTLPGFTAWMASIVGAWLFRERSREGPGRESPTTWLRKLVALGGALRKLVLGVAVAAATTVGALLVCAVIVRLETEHGFDPLAFRAAVAIGSLLLFVVLGFVLDFNKLSLHYFYRDRLVEAYLQTSTPTGDDGSLRLIRDNAEMRLVHLQGVRGPMQRVSTKRSLMSRGVPFGMRGPAADGAGAAPAATTAATSAPYHLYVTCLNLTHSRDMTLRDRRSDAFVFSRLFCGSKTTGYMRTERYRSGETKVARAMTISGAAASSAMGGKTFFAQALVMTLFNVRLGQWTENPGYRRGAEAFRHENQVFWPKYLLKELLGSMDAGSRLVNVSDGAHTGDNLGIGPLLQRRCRLIIACDAECDPEITFGSLAEAIRQAAIDDNVEIDLDLDPIRPDPGTGLSRDHFAVGRIRYAARAGRPAETGFLLVVKSSMNGDEPEPVRHYRKAHPTFPHQTTGDQFFDDAQFESYRELGRHMTDDVFETRLAQVLDQQGWTAEWGWIVDRAW